MDSAARHLQDGDQTLLCSPRCSVVPQEVNPFNDGLHFNMSERSSLMVRLLTDPEFVPFPSSLWGTGTRLNRLRKTEQSIVGPAFVLAVTHRTQPGRNRSETLPSWCRVWGGF